MLNASIKVVRYITAASLLIVFVIDIITPPAFVVDILYLCCIMLVFKQDTKTIISFSTAACLLIVIYALIFNHKTGLNLSELVNRGISILAILIVSYIAIYYRKLNQLTRLKEEQHLRNLKEMLFLTSHHVRKPVANILGLIENMNIDLTDLSTAELQ